MEGYDIVFNGSDHFTTQMNTEIDRHEILEGIDNLIEAITRKYRIKGDWTVKHGMRNTAKTTSTIEKVSSNSEEDEGYTEVVRRKKAKKQEQRGKNKEVTNASNEKNIVPRVVKPLYSTREINLRMKEKINYAPKYHPLDDPLPLEDIN